MRPFSDLAQGGLGVLFLKFGRDAELQADALGAEYTAADGWDPDEVPAFLTTLARISESSDRNGVPNWMATHPQPENRAERVGVTVKKVRAGGEGSWVVDRDGYLARIDGIVFGDDPEDGIVRGNVFLHPPLRFAIEFPEGWEITNSDEQVVAQEPGNKVFMVLRTIEPLGRPFARSGVAAAHARVGLQGDAMSTSATIGGMQAVLGTYEGNASGIGKVTARGAHVLLGRSTFFIGGIAPPDMYRACHGDFERTIQIIPPDEPGRGQRGRAERARSLHRARRGHVAVDRPASRQGAGERVDAGHHERSRHRRAAEAGDAAEDCGGGILTNNQSNVVVAFAPGTENAATTRSNKKTAIRR